MTTVDEAAATMARAWGEYLQARRRWLEAVKATMKPAKRSGCRKCRPTKKEISE